MIKSMLVATILIFLCCCSFRKNLTKPASFSYKSQNIEINFEIREIAKIKKQSWEKSGNKYFYYGLMSAKLTSKEKPKFLKLIYKNEDSEVYLDTIASVINFWDSDLYDSNNFRKNKIYVVFDDPEVDWSVVKIMELDLPKSMTRNEICKMLKEKSYQNYKKSCYGK